MGRGSSKAGRGGGYTKFSDDSLGMVYTGDGKDTASFFSKNSNSDELISEIVNIQNDETLSGYERYAFRRWSEGDFMKGQQYKGWDNMTEIEQRQTKMYDNILDKSVLNKGIEVCRNSNAQLVLGKGAKTDFNAIKAMQGKSVSCPANMSFAAASTGLDITNPQPVTYKLKIKGGTKGAGMWIGDTRINAWAIASVNL